MQQSARLVAMLLLLSLLTTSAFAGDTANPATNPQETAAGENASPTTGAPADPKPPAQSSSSSSLRGEDTPGGEVFLGYSYVRMSTDTRLIPTTTTVNEHFQFIP